MQKFLFKPKKRYICSAKQKVGRSAAPSPREVRKVRTGQGTLLRKAQMGVILYRP